MRRAPPQWALLVVAGALLAGAGTIFRTVEIDSGGAWALLGASLVLIGQWTAVELYQIMRGRPRPEDEEK